MKMLSNLDRYKKDLDELVRRGEMLDVALQYECSPAKVKRELETEIGQDAEAALDALPSFDVEYQAWYSEAKVLIKELLPDRLADFVTHYEKPRSRKAITYDSYRIEDCLVGLTVTGLQGTIVGPDAAIQRVRQQVAIVKSIKARFESSLFDIRQLVQVDLFDSELEAAKGLAKQKFLRAAGALAGVVLERHLRQVCENHDVKLRKKSPGIADLNNALKDADVVDVPQWRFIQHLADVRNLCTHDKKVEPTAEQLQDLTSGVTKMTKTLF